MINALLPVLFSSLLFTFHETESTKMCEKRYQKKCHANCPKTVNGNEYFAPAKQFLKKRCDTKRNEKKQKKNNLQKNAQLFFYIKMKNGVR